MLDDSFQDDTLLLLDGARCSALTCRAPAAAATGPLAPVKGFVSDAARPSYAPHSALAPVHMALDLRLDLPSRTLRARVRYVVLCSPSVASAATLPDSALYRALTLDAVALDIHAVAPAALDDSDDAAAAPPLSHHYDGCGLRIAWQLPFSPGERRAFVVEYSAIDPVAGLYFHVPTPQAADCSIHCITYLETERARYWLPCVDYPAVRTTLDFKITADASLTTLANGAESAPPILNPDGTKTTSFSLHHPCPSYLLCFAVGDFVEAVDDAVDGIPVRYYAPRPFTAEQLQLSLGRTPNMIRWLQKRVNYKFPWPKYYQIFTPYVGGAMENISLVTWAPSAIQDEVLAKSRHERVDSTNIHEMAHTYFGNLIVIRHFEHAWLKESWARYIETCWIQDHRSHDDYRYDLIKRAEAYFEECESYTRPIVCRTYDTSRNLFDQHTYPGGAWRIHMLRQLLGEDAFWTGVCNYVQTYAGKTVETDDFRRCLEAASGLNLTAFFDQWIYSPGYPKLRASYSYDDALGVARVTLTQTQKPTRFDLDVDVDLVLADGRVRSAVATFRADAADPDTPAVALVYVGKERPRHVEIDPHGKVLHTLEFAPAEDMLASAAKTYKALAKARNRATIDILAVSMARETNVPALEILANVASGIRDAAMHAAFTAFLAYPVADTGYYARAYAFVGLGRQGRAADSQRLVAALHDDTERGMHGIVRAGVLRALALVGDTAAHAALLHAVDTSLPTLTPDSVACAAIAALAESLGHPGFAGTATSGPHGADALQMARAAAVEALADRALRDRRPDVVSAAARALVRLGAADRAEQSRAAVVAALPAQDLPPILRTIARLDRPDPAPAAAATATQSKPPQLVEALRDRVARLEKVLEALRAKDEARETAAAAVGAAANADEVAVDRTA
ncbi:hypothetical protein HK405_006073 [Cladochytrium tenue]|nr:hypothetical protein HK405_006073 [Cladochytrium tenue]